MIRPYRDGAAGLGDRAAYVLKLHGGMRDVKAVGEHAVEAA